MGELRGSMESLQSLKEEFPLLDDPEGLCPNKYVDGLEAQENIFYYVYNI